MYIEVSSSRMRKNFSACLHHHLSTGDRILITRYGRGMAAMVSAKDLQALEQVENNREEFLEWQSERQLREFRGLKSAMEGEKQACPTR